MGAVSKLLLILKELNLPVIGVVENMKMTEGDYIKDSVKKYGMVYLNAICFDKDLEDSIGIPDKLVNTIFMKDLSNIMSKFI